MAKFLNTSATNYFLEELIKSARERLIIISPFLKLNARIKELLEDKDRMKIDVRIVYGKNELQPEEINWLKSLEFVRTSFCQNLHAKCYVNEQAAIITSMNLYEFSQVNNNEMGVFFDRSQEPELYRETLDEVQRLIRISDEIRVSVEKVDKSKDPNETKAKQQSTSATDTTYNKLTTSRLAKELGQKTSTLLQQLCDAGYLVKSEDQWQLTEAGKKIGGEFRYSKQYGPYFLWPKDLKITSK